MRAFFWDVTLENADDGAIKSFLKNNPPPTSGSVRAHNQSVKWEAVSPDLKTTDAANGARLLRNHILGGQTVPEHWYGGGGDEQGRSQRNGRADLQNSVDAPDPCGGTSSPWCWSM